MDKEKIKDKLMNFPAIVDIKTKKISNCEVGSKEYKHEQAHIEFSESSLGTTLLYFDQIADRMIIIFIVLTLIGIDIFKWFALVGIFLNLSIFIFEELYCEYQSNIKDETENKKEN